VTRGDQSLFTNSDLDEIRNNSNMSNHVSAGVLVEQNTAEANISNSVLSNNASGVLNGVAFGLATTRLYGCVITGNTVDGLTIASGTVFSHGNNAIRGNAGNETPYGSPLGLQ